VSKGQIKFHKLFFIGQKPRNKGMGKFATPWQTIHGMLAQRRHLQRESVLPATSVF
jgi:hypothetical protein